MVNVELWNVLLLVIKDAVSSTYKFKQLFWLLVENICLLLPKLNRIDPSRLSKDYVRYRVVLISAVTSLFSR